MPMNFSALYHSRLVEDAVDAEDDLLPLCSTECKPGELSEEVVMQY
jgi:hypothetical protein